MSSSPQTTPPHRPLRLAAVRSSSTAERLRGRLAPVLGVALGLALCVAATPLVADELVDQEIRLDEARARYGVSGRGVTIAVLDRGIDVRNPDFRNPDGTTRVKWLLDMSNQGFSQCGPNDPAPIEYSEAQINEALSGGGTLPPIDDVGHGDATAGMAASNGRALGDDRFAGIAPEADLIVVKMTAESVPAHGSTPAVPGFQGCTDEAIDWARLKMNQLGQPGVAIINSGVQWGPIDGTSAVSRKIDTVFPPTVPGRVMVIPGGDEGSLPSHAGGRFDAATGVTVPFERQSTITSPISIWYSGNRPAQITVELDNGSVLGPVGPGQSQSNAEIQIFHYLPGQEFYPWKSTSGDRAALIFINGHVGSGVVKLRSTVAGSGNFDMYSDVVGPGLTANTAFTDFLVPGRLQDYAATESAIVAGNSVIRTFYTDVDGFLRGTDAEGLVGELWLKSPGGPTRDDRTYGIDVVGPGQGSYASAAADSWWSSLRGIQPIEGDGKLIRFGGTSASAPITMGVVALMLELDPTLTTADIRRILRQTARQDEETGELPDFDRAAWGFGKLDALAALDRVACEAGLVLCLSERFSVIVDWRNFDDETGRAVATPFGSDDSGILYFFEEDNWEMMIKVLDGCGFNQRYWVLAAATTNVEYTLTVVDTQTGEQRVYSNPLGEAAPATIDTEAFATCDAASATSAPLPSPSLTRGEAPSHDGSFLPSTVQRTRRGPGTRLEGAASATASDLPSTPVALTTPGSTTCVNDIDTLCLRGGRFRIEVSWRNFEGETGVGRLAPALSTDSGVFYFFAAANWEMLVKVLDGCGLNQHYWVFAAATTNVEYTLTVTDLQTGEEAEYTNPLGTASPAIVDTSALPTCN